MAAPFFELHVLTRLARVEAVPMLRDAIVEAGGWVEDYREFSNKTACLSFEIEESRARQLLGALQRARIVVEPGSVAQLEAAADLDRPCRGSLEVTLLHGDPDEKGFVPSIPG